MDLDAEKRLNALLTEALARPQGERREFLKQACGDDPALLAEALALLDGEAGLGDFLEEPAGALGAMPLQIGPFRVVRLLGEGGMGRVFLAEQTEPLRRQVALKVLRTTLTRPEARLRFAAERQALARLSHPNIAQIYEAGTTEGGFPYFAMEYVPGVPVTEHCDARRLALEERLGFFLALCRGVQHAHQRGILHRDLKPSNLLVAEIAGPGAATEAVPKVIDFGIAKALEGPFPEGPLTDVPLHTAEQLMGTPDYMSPESLNFEGSLEGSGDPDTRTDVYALGILLYELLAGVRPFETRGTPMARLLRRIAEEDSPLPSRRLAALPEARREEIAAARRLDGETLLRRLRGDLDVIVGKAIARRREERYGSAAELAADVERHLSHQPVLARPPSFAYHASKLVRRHRLAVTAAAAVLLALVLGIAATSYGLVRARRAEAVAVAEEQRAHREAAAAEQVVEFLVRTFRVSDPWGTASAPPTARELLHRGAETLRTELADQPLVQARLLLTIGRVYLGLGLATDAEPLLAQALALRRQHLGEDHPEVAPCLEALAICFRSLGDLATAERFQREALALFERHLPPEDPDVADSLNLLANLLSDQGRFDEAAGLYRRVLALREAALPAGEAAADSFEIALVLENLAVLAMEQGRYPEAEPLLERAVAAKQAALRPDHPSLALSLGNLGNLLIRLEKYTEAEPLLRRAVEIQEAALGPESPRLTSGLGSLGSVLVRLGRHAEAEALFERSLAITRKAHGPRHPQVSISLFHLGELRRSQGRVEQAREFFLESLEIDEETRGPDHPYVADTLYHLANLLRDAGRPAEAEPHYRRALAIQVQTLPEDSADLAATRRAYAELLRSTDREAEARALEAP